MAQFILGATAAFVLNQPLPEKPGLQEGRAQQEPTNVFDGRLDAVDYDKGYVRCERRGTARPRPSLSAAPVVNRRAWKAEP